MPIRIEGIEFYGNKLHHVSITLTHDGDGHTAQLSANYSRWLNLERIADHLVQVDHIIGWPKFITHHRKPKKTTTFLTTGWHTFYEPRSKKTKHRPRAHIQLIIE